jgi:hypothetical protein
MPDNLLTIALLLVCPVLAFYGGIRIGERFGGGKTLPPIKTPVAAIKDAVERKKMEQTVKDEAQFWRNIENNDGYTEQERIWINGEKAGE